MRGLLLNAHDARRHAALLATLEGIEVVALPESEGEALSEEQIAGIEGAFFLFDGAHPQAGRRLLGVARRAPNLRWLHLGHAGVDAPVFQELMARGVVLTNSSGVTAEPIAQTAIAGMLALHRGLHTWMRDQREHAWQRHDDALPRDLRGQTIVVLGLGAIGGHVARFARAFGMHVVGVRRSPAGVEDGADEWVTPDRLAEVLPRADVLAITVPLTAQTQGMVDVRALALLPRGALVLNVARGQIVDEAALIEALRSGRLGGAYLDVFEVEPLPDDSPLWDLPNVLLSPHDAGRSAGNDARVDAIFAEEVQRWAHGEDSPRRVRDR
ncbi:MAG: D-2-hydroxyacid dehydrogenase [Dehalococcoidia bacterium]